MQVFCKLAVRRRAVPAHAWSWPAFLRNVAGLLPYAFEKADAKEKWGGENVFAVMFGGRSLRATAELVMGTSFLTFGGETDPGRREEAAALRRTVSRRLPRLLAAAVGQASSHDETEAAQEVFLDVGGPEPWARLLAALGPAVAAAGHWG